MTPAALDTRPSQAAAPVHHRPRRPGRRWAPLLVVAPLAAVALAASTGPVTSPVGQVLLVALEPLRSLGLAVPAPDPTQAALISAVRLPRAVLAALVGAGLAVSGAVMQAAFRNPLAEPGVTGVSSGAATGAVLVLVSGAATAWWSMPMGAFVGAVLAVGFVQLVGAVRRPGSPATLLLVGIALNALLGAVVAAALANAHDAELARSAMVWLNGDLTGAAWRSVLVAVGPTAVGTVVLAAFSRDLDLLALPEEHAVTGGLHVTRVRQGVLLLAALVTAAGVAVTGVLAFVGLVVPHLARLVVGPAHARLLPVSASAGAVLLVGADTAARMTFQPVTLQTGTVTALIGAPVLLALVLRRAEGTR